MIKFLEEVPIKGSRYVNKIKKVFGKILISFDPFFDIKLSVSEVFHNIFCVSTSDWKKGDLIFVVVPNTAIESIRVKSDFDETTHCTAKKNGEIVVRALAIRKGRLILYICLARNGKEITDAAQLGL